MEAVVVYFKVLIRHSPGGTKEDHKKVRRVGVHTEIRKHTFRIEVWTVTV
jgi:hypothetical protein